MKHIAFFGHNVTDAAVRRRAIAFMRAGHKLTGFMMRRGELDQLEWDNVDLGRSHDNAYLHRLRAIWKGASVAVTHADVLGDADLIYARNLDMLACAQLVRQRLDLRAPLIFECLDVHKRLTEGTISARILRRLERYLLNRTSLVVCSSPAFFSSYFEVKHRGNYKPYLMENRLISGDAFAQRPLPGAGLSRDDNDALRIGWFGNIRCRRSLELMKSLAREFGDKIHIELRGYAAPNVFPEFETEIAQFSNIQFGGRYRAPHDLGDLYAGVDIQWGGDFHEAGANSVWLLPNRLYEGGYFGTPLVCPEGTQTATWLTDHGGGFLVAEPLETSLPALIADLMQAPERIRAERDHLLSLEEAHFVEGPDETSRLIRAALNPLQPR